MPSGGHIQLPDGSVIVALSLARPTGVGGARLAGAEATEARVRVLVHARNRARALTRVRNLGFRSVYLRGNAAPPTPDEIMAVLHHPDGLVWRATPHHDTERWRPITALFRPTAPI